MNLNKKFYNNMNNVNKEHFYIRYNNPVENAYYNNVTYSKTTNFFRKCFCCVLDEKY